MPDITTSWDVANGRGDWTLVGPDLQGGSDLETALLVSLFSDRIAAADDVIPDGSGDPRGWWGDEGEAWPIGSRLWLLDRVKATPDIPGRAYDYIVEATRWMIADGVIASVEVLTEFTRPGMLGARVVLVHPDGARTPFAYQWAW